MGNIKNMMGEGPLVNQKSYAGKERLVLCETSGMLSLSLNFLPHPMSAQSHLEAFPCPSLSGSHLNI